MVGDALYEETDKHTYAPMTVMAITLGFTLLVFLCFYRTLGPHHKMKITGSEEIEFIRLQTCSEENGSDMEEMVEDDVTVTINMAEQSPETFPLLHE